MFSSFVEETDGPSFHIVGIKEEFEQAPLEQIAHHAEARHDSNSALETSLDILPENCRVHSHETSLPYVPDKSCCSSSEFASTASTASLDEISCTLSLAGISSNSSEISVPLIGYSVGFSTLVGPSLKKGMNFLDLLGRYGQWAFFNYLSNAANSWMQGNLEEPSDCLPIRLFPLRLKGMQLYIHADLTLTCASGDDEEDSGFDHVLARFSSISWHQARVRSRPRRRGSSHGSANQHVVQEVTRRRPHTVSSATSTSSMLKL